MHRIKQEHIYFIFILMMIVCIFQYGIHKICGFTLYPDEFGYWASAAEILGYDWTDVAALGSYYSFGYSVFLLPLLKIFSGGTDAYRAALAVNMIFMCAGMILLSRISARLFPQIEKVKLVLICGIATLYPAWIFYMQMTLAEALLTFLFVGITYLFLSLMQRPRVVTAVALAVVLVYTYSVHMRTVGIVAAAVLTLTLWGIMNPSMRKQILAVLCVLTVMGLAVVMIKRNVILSVFMKADAQVLSDNDYASQMWKIRDIFTLRGGVIFAEEIIGKVFYLGTASFGIFYWAVGWCIRESADLIKNMFRIMRKKEGAIVPRQWTAAFLLLAVSAEILICSIYMLGSAKADCVIYGRYNEFLMPVMLVVGIMNMLRSTKLVSSTFILGVIAGFMQYPILSVIEAEGLNDLRGYFVVGICRLLNKETFDPVLFFRDTWALGTLLMLLATGIVWIVKKWENTAWPLALIIVMEMLTGIDASRRYTYKVNQVNFENLNIVAKIEECADRDSSVVFLKEGIPEWIDFYQMQMPDRPIRVISAEDLETGSVPGDFLIADSNTQWKEKLSDIYDNALASTTYILYFNHEGAGEDEKDMENISVPDRNALYFWIS